MCGYCHYVDAMTIMWSDLTKKEPSLCGRAGSHLQAKSFLVLTSWGCDKLALKLEA